MHLQKTAPNRWVGSNLCYSFLKLVISSTSCWKYPTGQVECGLGHNQGLNVWFILLFTRFCTINLFRTYHICMLQIPINKQLIPSRVSSMCETSLFYFHKCCYHCFVIAHIWETLIHCLHVCAAAVNRKSGGPQQCANLQGMLVKKRLGTWEEESFWWILHF